MDLAEQIANSNSHIKAATTNKLQSIADQIKKLHQAACNLVKKPGTICHLYEKELTGSNPENPITQAYFSIMSPEDWGDKCPHKYLDSYRLGYDLQFTPVDELTDQKLKQENLMDQVFEQYTSGNLSIEACSSSFNNALGF